jgi:hypothetical protein
MPIDWAAVNWVNVGLLSAFAFLATLIGGILSFNNRWIGAILAALLFAALYIFWTYYPHGLVLPAIKSAYVRIQFSEGTGSPPEKKIAGCSGISNCANFEHVASL